MITTKRIFAFLIIYIIVVWAFVKCASASTTPITRTYNSGTIDRYEDDKAICYRTTEHIGLRSVSVSISCIKKDDK